MDRYYIICVFGILLSLVFGIVADNVFDENLSSSVDKESLLENLRREIRTEVETKFEEFLNSYTNINILKERLQELSEKEPRSDDVHTTIQTPTTIHMASINDALNVQKVMLHNAMERILYLEGKIHLNYEQEMAKNQKRQLEIIRQAKLSESLKMSLCHCNTMGTCVVSLNASFALTSESLVIPIPLKHTDRHLFYMVNLKTHQSYFLPQNDMIEAIAYDGIAKRLYWSSKEKSNIQSSYIYGCDLTVVVSNVVARGIAIDSGKNLVFFTTQNSVSFVDKTSERKNVCSKLGWITKITLDTKKNLIYVLTGYVNSKISIFRYDGCNRMRVIKQSYIAALAVDPITGILYYSSKSKLYKSDIERYTNALINKGDTRATNYKISSLVIHSDQIFVLYMDYHNINVFTTKGVKIKSIRNLPLEFGTKMMCITY